MEKLTRKKTYMQIKNLGEVKNNIEKDLSIHFRSVRNLNTQYKIARIYVSLIIIYSTGLRASNLLELSVGDCKDLFEGLSVPVKLLKKRKKIEFVSIRLIGSEVQRVKSRSKENTNIILQECVKLLYKDKTKEDPLFTLHKKNKDSKWDSIDHNNHKKGINSFLQKYGITSHFFRYHLITEADRVGVPLKQISEMVGHKSIQTTEGYLGTVISERNIKKVHAVLENPNLDLEQKETQTLSELKLKNKIIQKENRELKKQNKELKKIILNLQQIKNVKN